MGTSNLSQCARRLMWWTVAYLLLAIALLGANPFRGETVGPFDLLASASGWNPDGAPVEVRHRERSDIVDVLVPTWLEARRQLRDGTLPLWNPLAAGGTPALFDPIAVELTPGFLLFALAPDPAFGFYLSVLCCLVLAGLGMHLLIARYHAWPIAWFGGCSYMLCGFITAWLFWPHTHSAIWIPWLLLAVDSLVGRDSPRAYTGIALATALMVCGGFPFVAAIGMGAALVHSAVRAAPRGPRFVVQRSMSVLLGMVLGLMLVAVPLLTLASGLSEADLNYRRGGSALSLTDARWLLGPWLAEDHRVESNMYVGLLAMVLAGIGIAGTLGRRSRHSLGWTGLIFTLVGAVLVFGLLPQSVGAQLPVLSNNPWHRAILLLDIGLILLAVAGLGWMTEHASRQRVTLAFVLVACALQVVDLGVHFRHFNGATPARYFYAESPTLRYVRDRIRPFQYVAVDNSAFLVSGTTGGVGLADWYAHGLRSEALRAFLGEMAEDPFTTATATAIGIRKYEWNDDLLDSAAVCYALYPNAVEVLPIVLAAKNGAREALPPINQIPVVQRIRLDAPADILALSIRLATYRATDVDGEIKLTLSSADNAKPLATAVISGSQIRDNQMATFRFGRIVHLPEGDYRVEVFYRSGPASRRVTAWLFRDAPGTVLRDGIPLNGSLDFALYGAPEDKGGLIPVFRDRTVTVATNDGCVSGPYWIRDLKQPEGMASPPVVRLSLYAPAEFSVRVEGATREGYLVVPMRLRAGWEALVDGERMELFKAHGVLPAVKVPVGSSTVVFRYRPPHWPLGLATMLLSVLALAWLWRAGTRKPPEMRHI